MDKSMGRGSDFKSGPTGTHSADKTPMADEHDPKHVKSFIDGLKGLLGLNPTPPMGAINPKNAESVHEALGNGIAEGSKAWPE
jgi:hypothetical protein